MSSSQSSKRLRSMKAGSPPSRKDSSEVLIVPSTLALTAWTLAPGSRIVMVLPDPSHEKRQGLLRAYADGEWRRFHPKVHIDAFSQAVLGWVNEAVLENFSWRIVRLGVPADKSRMDHWFSEHTSGLWDILWALIAVEDFLVEEPLRAMVDQTFYLVHDVHRALWEARFLTREYHNFEITDHFLRIFVRWITGAPLGQDGRKALEKIGIDRLVTTDTEKFDVLFCLLTLASHNGLLTRAIFMFDDLDRALVPSRRSSLRQLRDFIEHSRRWSRIGCPIGLLVGFSGTRSQFSSLKKYDAKLANEIEAGLQWARKSVP